VLSDLGVMVENTSNVIHEWPADAVLFFTTSSVNASSSNATVYSEAWPKVPTKRWWIAAEAVWREDNVRKRLETGNMFARKQEVRVGGETKQSLNNVIERRRCERTLVQHSWCIRVISGMGKRVLVG
jgi:hypothetical protein